MFMCDVMRVFHLVVVCHWVVDDCTYQLEAHQKIAKKKSWAFINFCWFLLVSQLKTWKLGSKLTTSKYVLQLLTRTWSTFRNRTTYQHHDSYKFSLLTTHTIMSLLIIYLCLMHHVYLQFFTLHLHGLLRETCVLHNIVMHGILTNTTHTSCL